MAPQYAQPFEVLQLLESRLDVPLRTRKPTMFFVNSVSDLFHEDVPDAFINRVFAVMALAPQHTFQILTKRAERMRDYMTHAVGRDGSTLVSARESGFCLEREMHIREASIDFLSRCADSSAPILFPLRNVWLGVSVENQHFADERIPLLLETPAAVRFISAEPLLDEVDLTPHLEGDTLAGHGYRGFSKGPRLDWAIVGGESGPGARPFDIAWARSIVQQCKDAGVPVFVKQLGAVPVIGRDAGDVFVPDHEVLLRDRKGGDPSEWPEDLRVREFPERRSA
jgi:protein gp37